MQQFIDKLISRLEEKREFCLKENALISASCIYHIEENVKQLAEEYKIGEISDGYHTFNELYHHRAVLFATICNSNKELAWKSKLHDTGDMYEGMFIVGIETPQGQATYHYDIEPYWDMFKVKELPKAPKWDGHTPDEAIKRIGVLAEEYKTRTNADRIRAMTDEELAKMLIYDEDTERGIVCSDGEEFLYLENALRHELQWLQSEVKEGE